MSNFYDRRIEIISNLRRWTYPELDMTFSVKFNFDSVPDESDISIFNLADDSIARMSTGDDFSLSAGYGEDVGTIADGVIAKISVEKNGVDREVKIKTINVTNQYLDRLVIYTYDKGVTSYHLIEDILGYVGIKPNVVQLGSPQTYQLGFVANGKALDLIRRVANDADSKVIIRNSSISVVPDYNGDEDVAFVLNAKTGLIDITAIEETNSPAKYKIKCLLNHAINAYTILQIQSATFNGNAVCMEGTHSFNGTDFITEVKIIPL